MAVGDHAGEDVEPPGRALRVRLRADVLGQGQLLDQRHQVGTVALQHRPVAQVDLLEGEPLDLLLDSGIDVREEGAAQRPGEVAEPQVDARRLHRLGPDPVVAGADPLVLDRPVELLGGQHARARTRPLLLDGALARACRLDHPPETIRRASAAPRCGVSANSSTTREELVDLLHVAVEHLPGEQRGDATHHRLVGRLRDLAPVRALRSPLAQVADETLQRGLVAVIDAAAGPQALDQGDARQRRIGGQGREEGSDAVPHPGRPFLGLVLAARLQHRIPDPVDRRLVGGVETVVLAPEVLVEVTL